MKLIRGRTRWSDIEIDADKDMQGRSLTNLKNLGVGALYKQDGSFIILRIGDGYLQFYPGFGGIVYLDKNGSITFYNVVKGSIGARDARAGDGWFAGNLGLGVIREPGETLMVDVIYDDNYSEKASDLTERIYSYDSNFPISDWKVENINTFTENGIITGIKLQLDGYSTYDVLTYYELYEDGTEIGSLVIGTHAYSTHSIEVNTLKGNATYEGKINPQGAPSDGECGIKNRYLYFRKRYLGIKAG